MIKKATALLLGLSMITGTTGAYASEGGEAYVSSGSESINELKMEVSSSDENHYTYSVEGEGGLYQCLAEKNGNEVVFTYMVNGVVENQTKTTVEIAEVAGERIVNEIENYKLNNSTNAQFAASSTYNFDGIVYSRASSSQPFDHPDKGFYGISPFSTWSKNGYSKSFTQVNVYDSNSVINGPVWAIGGGIGAIIGSRGGVPGAVVGAFLGGLFGGIVSGQAYRLADENGCMWIIMDQKVTYVEMYGKSYYKYYHVQVGPFIQNDVLIPLE